MAQYQYQQLERSLSEIRLLRLVETDGDAGKDGAIPCEIKTFSLDDDKRPQYVALSYTWGVPKTAARLCTNEGYIGIVHNLKEALQHLRVEDLWSWLWVDAVCINQHNNDEKSWQVQLMHRIYYTAEFVFIWLGPAADNSDLVFERLKDYGTVAAEHACIKNWQIRSWYGQFRRYSTVPQVSLRPTDLTLEQVLATVKINDAPDATIPFTPTVALLSRPWWTRIWVLQEIWIAHTAVFICGGKKIRANHMAAAMTVFALHRQASGGVLYTAPDDHINVLQDMRPYLMLSSRVCDGLEIARTKIQVEMLSLLLSTSPYAQEIRRLTATDARDRVYALLGLSWDAGDMGIQVDYKKTSVEIYTEVTMALIGRHGISLLGRCFFPKALPDLPSWVIDWSASPRGYTMPCGPRAEYMEFGPNKTISGTEPAFYASKGIHTSSDLYLGRGGPDILCLLACQVDVIDAVLDERVLDAFRLEFDTFSLEKASHREQTLPVCGILNTTYDPNALSYPDSFSANPYISLDVFDKGYAKRMYDIVQNLISAIRQMAQSSEDRYSGPVDCENAIWRTVIADQESIGRDEWVRPAGCFLPLMLLLELFIDRREAPIGLTGLVRFAHTQRLHSILQNSGLFSEFTFEATKDIVLNRLPLRPLKLATAEQLRAALRTHNLLRPTGINTEDYLDPFWHDGIASKDEFMKSVAVFIEEKKVPDFEKEGVEMLAEGYQYINLIRCMTIGRALFTTKSGYLGLGPMNLRPGDIVIVAHESAVPFVLKPRPDGKYEFVGECYVHGIMDGEFIGRHAHSDKGIFELYEIG